MKEEPTRQDDDRFRLGHMRYYLQLVTTLAADNNTLETDRVDIILSLNVAHEMCSSGSSSKELSRLFVGAVNNFAGFLGFRGALQDRIEWGKKALTIAETMNDDAAVAELCASTIAWPLLQQGNHEQAKAFSKRGLQIALNCNSLRWAGEASRSLSGIARDKLQAVDAKYWAERAMDYGRQLNHLGLEQGATMDLAYAAILNHDYNLAEALLRGLLEIYLKQNHAERIANYYGGVALTMLNLGKFDEAQELYDKQFAIGRDLDSEVIMGETEFGLAKLAEINGNPDKADLLRASARRRFRLSGITRPGRAEQFVFINPSLQGK